MAHVRKPARTRARNRQHAFVFRTWGGRRKGAGRKQVNERKSQPHRRRERVTAANGVLVTLRVRPEIRRLRRRDAYRAIRKGMQVVLRRADFRVVHVSIQANHVHFIVEGETEMAIARGMQALQTSAARHLNNVELDGRTRKGAVFVDRYHSEVIATPTHARHALAYVLNNWRRHKEDRPPQTRTWQLDPYSSAASFTGWSEGVDAILPVAERRVWPIEHEDEPLPVCAPQTWLMRDGWRRGGKLSLYEVPGKH